MLIGDIAVTWSDVELQWYLIFTTLMPETPRSTIDAIFFMFDTSKRQRGLILKVAEAIYPTDEHGRVDKRYNKLGKLNALTDEASGDRNAAVHALIYQSPSLGHLAPPEYRVSPGSHPTKKNKLAGKKLNHLRSFFK